MSSLDVTVERYVAAWNLLDFKTLESLWDTSEEDIYYVAEEIDQPMKQLSCVVAYWQETAAIVETLTMTVTDLQTKYLTGDIAVVTYEMHMTATLTGATRPIGVDVRVSAILRKRSDEWRFIHYAEAPLGALPFVRRAYQSNAR